MHTESRVPYTLNINDVARILRVSTRTVRTLVAKQKMPAPLSSMRAMRWHPDVIDSWLKGETPDAGVNNPAKQ